MCWSESITHSELEMVKPYAEAGLNTPLTDSQNWLWVSNSTMTTDRNSRQNYREC